MATFYGENNTKAFQNVPTEKIGPGEQNGRIFIARDKFVGQISSVAGDIVEMMKIPFNARILGAKVYASTPSAGTLCQFEVGFASDTDALITLVDSGAGASLRSMDDGGPGPLGVVGGPFQKLAAEDTVILTPLNAWSGDVTVDLMVFYTVE